MKPIRQLLRQPLKSLSGVILIALAVAILCMCVGQAVIAGSMQDNLEEIYSSSAQVTNQNLYIGTLNTRYQTWSYEILYDQPDEVVQWMEEISQEYPHVVKTYNRPGLASAYIPELTADNHTRHFYNMNGTHPYASAISIGTSDTNYCQTMLEITLESVGTEFQPYQQDRYRNEMEGVSIAITGRIERVLGLQEGYADPTGFTARMTLVLPDEQALEALKLEVGQRYLVYGMDYTDLDWDLRMEIARTGRGLNSDSFKEYPKIPHFDPENMVYYTQEYIEKMGWADKKEYTIGWYEYLQTMSTGRELLRGVHLTNLDMLRYRSVSLTLLDLSSMNIGVSETYRLPTIAKLSGTAEEFLAGEEGKLWQDCLNNIAINNHSFAVISVDDLLSLGDFANQKTTMPEGRQFTPEELETGAKVCVISREVAQLNGLQVGDTITLNYYGIDYENPYQVFISEGYGTANPSAYSYGATTPMAQTGEIYTIVGLYQKDTPWEGENSPYDFRVNTVFVPKASVTGEMDYGETGMFLCLALHNGMTETFEALVARDGHAGLFDVIDQGYESIKNNLHNYEQIAGEAAIIGAVVYAIVLILYLIFYPAMQRVTLSVMAKIGASRGEMLRFMMGSCLSIQLPGTAAGVGLSVLLWDALIGALAETSRTTMDLELDMTVVLTIAAAQLLLAAVLSLLVGISMTLNLNLLNKGKGKLSLPGLKQMPLATVGAAVFAAVIVFSLCALHASSEAEHASYQAAYREAEVSVTLVDQNTNDPYALNASPLIKELVYANRFSFSLTDYLTDAQCMTYTQCHSLNKEPYEQTIWGINGNAKPELLTAKWNAKITWLEGYDASCMDSYSDMYLLMPENMEYTDYDPETEGTQILLSFVGYRNNYIHRYYECVATVAGTYTNDIHSKTIYCSIEPLFFCGNRVSNPLALQHFSATIRDNDQIPQLREEAKKYFATDGEEVIQTVYEADVVFKIQSDTLERMSITLENSIRFNEMCALLLFVMSAGAGFFLGFLMIRSRKREIILMRTLGRANGAIFAEYAAEQMLCILLGTVAGGLVFRWAPLSRLAIFNGIYFVGLAAALILFLNSKLLTTVKEDE